jgi:Ni,Fe-hydrogenase maturation factor
VEGFQFIKCSSPDFLEVDDNQLVILDVVKNAKDVVVINDVDKIKEYTIVSTHDLDLGHHLKLLKEIGELKKLTIIGLPPGMDKETAKQKIEKILKELFPVHL